jgi:hypothetical protein
MTTSRRVLMATWESIAVALLIGLIFIVVVVPVVCVFLFTLFDVFARIDTGVINKFFWAGVVLLMPLLGLLLYWLFRPKRFNPWLEKEEPRYSLAYATASVTSRPALRLVHSSGGAAPAAAEGQVEVERAA